jgi:hypothetical protein
MINKMNVAVPEEYFQEAKDNIPLIDFKLTLNYPTGDFFYSPWKIKDEYAGTVWERLLSTLPGNVGEARLIRLDTKNCYPVHADIDNRWHYTFHSINSYLIDVDTKTLYDLEPGFWYYMDAGKMHSAVNMDCDARVSLVVRELLPDFQLTRPKNIRIVPDTSLYNFRFLFDQYYSKLLNGLQTKRLLTSFSVDGSVVSFQVDHDVNIPKYPEFEVSER